ncbi:MAG: hypothetical protein NTV07_01110 [Candidatus Omnitrophica bacterium]|nr:hypothetical protein [Candidatus Omnitrophota bacterium]
MRRFLGLSLVIIMPIMLGGCLSDSGKSGSGRSSAVSDQSNVTLSLNFPEMLAMNRTNQDIRLAKIIDFITMSKAAYATDTYTFITSLHIRVTGSGMSDIIYEADIPDPSISLFVTLAVPNGLDRRFYIELQDRSDKALYSGDLSIDVGSAGVPQEITVDVALDAGINADDYIAIGRDYLEKQKLEQAYIAFDTAVSIDADHPEANFFRGFTHLLLLIQKDDPDPDVDATTVSETDIADMLNLYSGLTDIYSSSIVPDIYDNDNDGTGPDTAYGDKLDDFYNTTWKPWYDTNHPTLATDSGVDVLENVILPEVDDIISDLSKTEASPGFSTTFEPSMYFEISSTIKVDSADVYVLEAIAYGLKAYYNHLLAYTLQTKCNYWYDNLKKARDKDPSTYIGVGDVIDRELNETGEELFDFASDADSRFNTAKSAYSTGLNKLKSSLEFIDTNRGTQDKMDEDHIFNVVDIDDSALASKPSLNKVNFTKVIDNIAQIKDALSAAAIIESYDEYEDNSTGYDSEEINLSKLFSSATAPYRNTRPEFYYHIV